MATFTSNSAADTEAFARRMANQVAPGSILALQGELGTGKTQFTKGLVAALGSTAAVTSPTFTIIHEYSGGRLPIYHFDFFRLEDPQRLIRIGLDDYLYNNGVCVLEWADRFPGLIPQEALWIRFHSESDNRRIIEYP